MHDRLVSRRIDALHQCFLVFSLKLVIKREIDITETMNDFCIPIRKKALHFFL